MDNESSYNCSFLFSSLVDHDPDSQDVTFNKSEANSNSNSNQDSRPPRKKPKNSDFHSDGFSPDKFFSKEAKYAKDDDFYISPAVLNANNTLEDVLLTKTNIFTQPEDVTEINEECEVFTNDRGTVKLCIDGSLFIKNMKSGNTCYWQCVQKNLKNCHACAVTCCVGEKHYLKRIRREHSHEPAVKNTRGFAEVYELQIKNLKENLSDCKFTRNRNGNPKLVIDGFFYFRHSTKGQAYYWKCEQRGQCDACVVTKRNSDGTHKMGKLIREHTHQPKNDTEMKDIRLSYVPRFTQNKVEQIKNYQDPEEQVSDIPESKNIKEEAKADVNKNIEDCDSSSSLSLIPSNMPKLLTLKSSLDQEEEQFESDNSQSTSQFNKKNEKFSRQSSQISISQSNSNSGTMHSSTAIKKTMNKPKLQFKRSEVGEKCEFVFLIDGVYKMLLNGFAYEMTDGSENRTSATWKCSGHAKVYVECSAIAETFIYEGEHYLRCVKGKHNHPRCDEDMDDSGEIPEEESSAYPEFADVKNFDYLNDVDAFKNRLQNEMTKFMGDDVGGKCEFIVTKRGLPKLTRKGYFYVRNSVNKNRSEIIYWKCEMKGKCTGTLVTVRRSNGFFVKSNKGHNHPPDSEKYNEPRYATPEELGVNFPDMENESQLNDDSSDDLPFTNNDEKDFKFSNQQENVHFRQKQEKDPLAEEAETRHDTSSRMTIPSKDIKLELITRAHGKPKISRNGYYYRKISHSRSRPDVTYWKCELKGNCPGFLIAVIKDGGYYFKSEKTHSHPPDPDKYGFNRKCAFGEISNSSGLNVSWNKPTTSGVDDENGMDLNSDFQPSLNSNLENRFINTTSNFGSRQPQNHNFDQKFIYDDEELEEKNNELNEQDTEIKSDHFNVKSEILEELPLVPEGGDPSLTYECEFIISCQGNPKLCLNGYMYTKNRDKNTNFYWNCELKKSRQCMGYCVTEVRNGKHIVKKIRDHNHQADLNREMLSKKLSNILQKVYSKPLWNPRKIIDFELSKLPEDIRRQLPKAYSIQRMVKRKVQEKVSNVKQSSEDGGYAPIPNLEPSSSKPTQLSSEENTLSSQQPQNSNPRHPSQQLYRNEYNYNNLYNASRSNFPHLNPYYQQQQQHQLQMQQNYYRQHMYNSMKNYTNDPNNQNYGSNSFGENHFPTENYNNDDNNCEIKNEPIDDYGYQNFDEQNTEHEPSQEIINSEFYENNESQEPIGIDVDCDDNENDDDAEDDDLPWNVENGANGAYGNSFLDDGPPAFQNNDEDDADDIEEIVDNGHENQTSQEYCNEFTFQNSTEDNSQNSNSIFKHNSSTHQHQPSEDSQNNSQTNNTNYIKKNQIAKKRIRAPQNMSG